MAFNDAIKLVLSAEGGYSNLSADRGGETYKGITRKNFPSWKGWTIIDQYKPLKHNQIINLPLLDEAIKDFYYINFWLPLNLDSINPKIAALTFDFAVNSGTKTAARALQKVTKDTTGAKIIVDGVIGKKTIDAINQAPAKKIFDALMQHRVNFYKTLVANDPSQSIFITGWLNRLSKFKFEIAGAAVLIALVLAGFILSRTS
jgi:lysozyme family protein